MAAYIGFQPSDFYNTTLYTGTGASQAITGVGFQPDLVWTKNRDSTDNNNLFDAVRGVREFISSNLPSAEGTAADSLNSFDADGFTIGAWGDINGNTEDYASWNWKAGTTTGIGSGDITPSAYSFNTTAGFSIVAYTGTLSGSGIATVPHGLGAAPQVVITKSLSDSREWYVQHPALTTPSYYVYLSTNAAEANGAGNGTMSAPTSTVFDTNWGSGINESGQTYIAYCFAEKKGYSKFGSYTGNANANGPFVYLGFRPAFLMIKSVGLNAWYLFDDKRIGYNAFNSAFEADSSYAETSPTTYLIDIMSNGFKPRHLSAAFNASGQKYLYMAFAKFPFVSSNSIPGTAR